MVFFNSTEDYSQTFFNQTNGINFTTCRSSDVSLEIPMTGGICCNYTNTCTDHNIENDNYIIEEVATWIWRIVTPLIFLIGTIGNFVITVVSNTLWYIDPFVETMDDRSCTVPQALNRFFGLNNPKLRKQKVQPVESPKLLEHATNIDTLLELPFMREMESS